MVNTPYNREVHRTVRAYLAQHPAARMFVFFTGDPIPESVESCLLGRADVKKITLIYEEQNLVVSF